MLCAGGGGGDLGRVPGVWASFFLTVILTVPFTVTQAYNIDNRLSATSYHYYLTITVIGVNSFTFVKLCPLQSSADTFPTLVIPLSLIGCLK